MVTFYIVICWIWSKASYVKIMHWPTFYIYSFTLFMFSEFLHFSCNKLTLNAQSPQKKERKKNTKCFPHVFVVTRHRVYKWQLHFCSSRIYTYIVFILSHKPALVASPPTISPRKLQLNIKTQEWRFWEEKGHWIEGEDLRKGAEHFYEDASSNHRDPTIHL